MLLKAYFQLIFPHWIFIRYTEIFALLIKESNCSGLSPDNHHCGYYMILFLHEIRYKGKPEFTFTRVGADSIAECL